MCVCRFVNDVLQKELKNLAGGKEGAQNLFWRLPTKRTHRKGVILSAVNSQLLFEIIEGIELMRGIKVFVIFAVRALNLTIVSRSEGTNELVLYTTLFERTLKQCEVVGCRATETLGKLKTVIGLDTLYFNPHLREVLYNVQCKLSRAVGAVFFKRF